MEVWDPLSLSLEEYRGMRGEGGVNPYPERQNDTVVFYRICMFKQIFSLLYFSVRARVMISRFSRCCFPLRKELNVFV